METKNRVKKRVNIGLKGQFQIKIHVYFPWDVRWGGFIQNIKMNKIKKTIRSSNINLKRLVAAKTNAWANPVRGGCTILTRHQGWKLMLLRDCRTFGLATVFRLFSVDQKSVIAGFRKNCQSECFNCSRQKHLMMDVAYMKGKKSLETAFADTF